MWNESQQDTVDLFCGDAVPAVDESYLTSIFGVGKNGMREIMVTLCEWQFRYCQIENGTSKTEGD